MKSVSFLTIFWSFPNEAKALAGECPIEISGGICYNKASKGGINT